MGRFQRQCSALLFRLRKVSAKQQPIVMLIFVICVVVFISVLQTKSLCKASDRPVSKMSHVTFEPLSNDVTDCVLRVHIFGNLTDMQSWLELTSWYHLFQRSRALNHTADIFCPLHNCILRFTISTNTNHFRGKDAIIFGSLPKAFDGRFSKILSTEPLPKQTWFYYSTETPLRVVNWNRDLRVADLKYHKMMTYRRDSDIHIPFGYYRKRARPLTDEEFNANYGRNKTKLAALMTSNCGQVFWPRVSLADQLSQMLPMDRYGRCGELQCLPRRSEMCYRMLQSYKFYMTLANSECSEYITEKFWNQALGQGIVPVVYGAHKTDFERLGPPNSFIHLSDFSSLKEVAKYLKTLGTDHDTYMQYLQWARDYEVVNTFPTTINDLCRIIPHVFNGTTQTLRKLGESTWYQGCRNQPSNKDMMPVFKVNDQDLAYMTWTLWGSKQVEANHGLSFTPF